MDSIMLTDQAQMSFLSSNTNNKANTYRGLTVC